jgi:catechol 2,3-dioxygenase-like lactoylglutathione lyase family enzyme
MLTTNPLVAFVGTTDRARAKEFYGSILGLKLLREEPLALAYECNGTALRVVDVDNVVEAPYTVLGWSVKDAGKAVADLVERGVEMIQYDDLEQDGSGVWTSPGGARVAWFRDPDGNVLSVSQAPRQ